MNSQGVAYLLFGFALVALFGLIIVFYYSKKRKKTVEDPKYRMLDDGD
jgi:cbb3-type cytochrome oxidase subunit 3